jgi:hypothetical protein
MSQVLTYDLPEHLKARRAAQRRDRIVQGIAAAVTAVAIVLAGLILKPINHMRRDLELLIDPSTVAGLPPDIAILGKLGTFRALAIDWASIRAERLKEEGKTYEAKDLYDIVCELQPRFPQVWINAAWNMAYNISVSQYTPEARWQWVRNGIVLLRDKGIQYNPRAVLLYKELAWIYWHKMGDFMDDEHRSYRRALAVEMESVLGQPPVTLSDEDALAWFQRIVDAPRNLDRFLREDAEVQRIVQKLRGAGLPSESICEFVARYDRTGLTIARLAAREEVDAAEQERREHCLGLLHDPENAAAVERLLAALRSDALRNQMKFDLDYLFSLMKNYGPFDLRSPYAHALYWSEFGTHYSQVATGIPEADAVNTARLLVYSLQGLARRGRLICVPKFDDPFTSYVEESADTRFIPEVYAAYLRLGEEMYGETRQWAQAGIRGTGAYFRGFVTRLHEWIDLLYYEGGERNEALAEQYLAWLRDNNPHPDGTTQEHYLGTLDHFIEQSILEQMATYRQSGPIVRGFLLRSLKHLSLGQEQPARKAFGWAKRCYEIWQKDIIIDVNERRQMQPMRILYRDAIIAFMTHPAIEPLAKANLWLRLEQEPRQLAYDHLLPNFQGICDAQDPPWTLERAFPEPPGMKEFRELLIDVRGAPPARTGVDQGTRYRN